MHTIGGAAAPGRQASIMACHKGQWPQSGPVTPAVHTTCVKQSASGIGCQPTISGPPTNLYLAYFAATSCQCMPPVPFMAWVRQLYGPPDADTSRHLAASSWSVPPFMVQSAIAVHQAQLATIYS